MKKLLSLFVAVMATCALWADHDEFYSSTEVNDLNYNIYCHVHYESPEDSIYKNGTYTYYASVTGVYYYAYSLTQVTIPSSITPWSDTYPVTQIAERAFRNSSLSSITLPTSITTIGSEAFYGCTALHNLVIPNTVTSIGEDAFYDVRFVSYQGSATGSPWGAKYVNAYQEGDLFYETNAKTKLIACSTEASEGIAIPNTVQTIGEYAFENCTQLTNIYIPTSVITIEQGAFSGCTGLTTLSVPSNVTSIGEDAFYQVFNVSYQGSAEGAPWGARNLNAYMEGNLVYSDATKTRLMACAPAATGEIIVPNSVKTIADRAFYDCDQITSVVLGKQVDSIGDEAFYNCTFSSITIPSSVTYIGENVFRAYEPYSAMSYKYYLQTVTINSESIVGKDREYNNSLRYVFGSTVTTYIIGEGVTRIGRYAFYECYNLQNITIPNSVTSVGEYAFSDCENLPVIDGIRYADTYIVEVTDKTQSSYTIQEGTRWIGSEAFANCSIMSTLTIPVSVCYVGSGWYGCTNLKTIIWNAKKCTLTSSFYDSQLTSVTFGNQVEEIPHGVCTWQTKLTAINIPNSVKRIGNSAFEGCMGLTSITIPNSVEVIERYAFEECENLSAVTLGNQIDSIGNHAFSHCEKLTAITIPASVKYIGESAFAWCSQLLALEVPNPETYCENASILYGCASMETISGPASLFNFPAEYMGEADYLPYTATSIKVISGELDETGCITITKNYKRLKTLDVSATTNTTLADEAFMGCYNIESLKLPSQLERVPYMAVAGCKNLKSIDIPASVEEIDQSAFEDCRSIETITFGGVAKNPARMLADGTSKLKKIGNWAFYNAHLLKNLIIPEGVEEIGDAAFYGCTYLEDLVLPSSVRTIGDNCFALCSKMKKITVTSTTPPTIYAKTFYDVNRAIPVYVPTESIDAYKDDTYWKEFDIQGGATALDQLSNSQAEQFTKIIRNGQLLILRDGKVYTATGCRL